MYGTFITFAISTATTLTQAAITLLKLLQESTTSSCFVHSWPQIIYPYMVARWSCKFLYVTRMVTHLIVLLPLLKIARVYTMANERQDGLSSAYLSKRNL